MRIGLVGYGKGGRYFHAPLIASTPHATLAGVVTRSPERRAELAQDHPQTPAYDTLAQLIDTGIDAVIISTPPDTRYELIMEAIEHGIPVVSDKPFARDETQARELVRAAEEAGVMLTVYQNRRWDSDVLTVRRLISNGTLGTIQTCESRIEVFDPVSAYQNTGGGVLRDIGSHLVDQALLLFGPAQSVYAEVSFLPDTVERDDGFFLSLHHEGGVISHIHGNCLQKTPGPRFRVTGSTASYTVEGLDGQTQALFDGRSPRTEKDRWGLEEHRRWGWLQRGEDRERVPSERGRWDLFYSQLAQALQGKARPPVDPWDAVACIRVLDAARQSGQEGCVVSLG
ncbi:putative dehydrogenase [Pseudomonas duriflava]|uniref:Putative dehydrogenase n=1 Tax=Pseudomonas duriflava TaxID=459528 RepID=A0A562QDW1_9PSED|nr:Gfo/Idh/MocA family oxidoreductase [Pseudomonas duriflava]TWI54931.1 putative dehydrogenase [Pseudomonas duriflava]